MRRTGVTRRVTSAARIGAVRIGAVRICAPLIGAALAACGGGQHHAPAATAGSTLETAVISEERAPLERRLDGIVEAVDQATVSAQTSGRVAQILYDANDVVPAGAVIVRLRSAEQHAGLSQAEASLSEARARELEAQTR